MHSPLSPLRHHAESVSVGAHWSAAALEAFDCESEGTSLSSSSTTTAAWRRLLAGPWLLRPSAEISSSSESLSSKPEAELSSASYLPRPRPRPHPRPRPRPRPPPRPLSASPRRLTAA